MSYVQCIKFRLPVHVRGEHNEMTFFYEIGFVVQFLVFACMRDQHSSKQLTDGVWFALIQNLVNLNVLRFEFCRPKYF